MAELRRNQMENPDSMAHHRLNQTRFNIDDSSETSTTRFNIDDTSETSHMR